jgi:hypothetical protein
VTLRPFSIQSPAQFWNYTRTRTQDSSAWQQPSPASFPGSLSGSPPSWTRQTERFIRYLAHLSALGILDCRNPALAAHQFICVLNEFFLWPWVTGRENLLVPVEEVIEETIQMFLQRYRRSRPEPRSGAVELNALPASFFTHATKNYTGGPQR